MAENCPVCHGARWVCEDHPGKPWDDASEHPDACHCGGAGAPCTACNHCDRETAPEMPPGYRTILDREGSVN